MKKIVLIVLTGFVLIISSCEEEYSHLEKLEKELLGNWNWVESYGGMTGRELKNPASEGYKMGMHFYEKGTVDILIDDTLHSTSEYYLSREESILLHEDFDFLTIENSVYLPYIDSTIVMSLRYMIEIGDTLILNHDAYDSYGHMYVRD